MGKPPVWDHLKLVGSTLPPLLAVAFPNAGPNISVFLSSGKVLPLEGKKTTGEVVRVDQRHLS